MKKTILTVAIVFASALLAMAATHTSMVDPDNYAEIKFDTLVINLGKFSEKDARQSCSFGFTNVGTAPLIINQASASCGCTVPTYTKTPIQPGERGSVDVTYNGKGKTPGYFKKVITVTSNAKKNVVRLTIEGEMTSSK